MMLYPTNSADRRQQPCTTTIRSRRAHPRHVLDTAALNAYVPNNVGSKSHNELTWNHVVSVFTFFGLLMTALVSLCCWSHFQFIVERRRLGANTEFTPLLGCRRRLIVPFQKGKNITVTGAPDSRVNGVYKHTTTEVPTWLSTSKTMPTKEDNLTDQVHIFGGSDYEKAKTVPKVSADWKEYVGMGQWYISTDKKDNNDKIVIFFDPNQKKWHMGGKDGLLYRSKTESGTAADMPSAIGTNVVPGWGSKLGRDADPTRKEKKKRGAKTDFALGDKLDKNFKITIA